MFENYVVWKQFSSTAGNLFSYMHCGNGSHVIDDMEVN